MSERNKITGKFPFKFFFFFNTLVLDGIRLRRLSEAENSIYFSRRLSLMRRLRMFDDVKEIKPRSI